MARQPVSLQTVTILMTCTAIGYKIAVSPMSSTVSGQDSFASCPEYLQNLTLVMPRDAASVSAMGRSRQSFVQRLHDIKPQACGMRSTGGRGGKRLEFIAADPDRAGIIAGKAAEGDSARLHDRTGFVPPTVCPGIRALRRVCFKRVLQHIGSSYMMLKA